MEITIEIEGLEKLKQGLAAAPAETIKETQNAIAKSVVLVTKQAMRNAPVNKQGGGGNLRQSIRYTTDFLRGVISVTARYAYWVHEGTNPHDITVVKKRVLANARTGQFFGKKVHHPGTQPNPFLKEAIEDVKPAIESIFSQSIQNVLSKIARQ